MRRPRSQWLTLFQEFKSSGLSTREFCTQHGLQYVTFMNWHRRFVRGETDCGFTEVTLPVHEPAAYTVVLRNGRQVQLSNGFHPGRLQQLIQTLESC